MRGAAHDVWSDRGKKTGHLGGEGPDRARRPYPTCRLYHAPVFPALAGGLVVFLVAGGVGAWRRARSVCVCFCGWGVCVPWPRRCGMWRCGMWRGPVGRLLECPRAGAGSSGIRRRWWGCVGALGGTQIAPVSRAPPAAGHMWDGWGWCGWGVRKGTVPFSIRAGPF
jgi:hypothetical protein